MSNIVKRPTMPPAALQQPDREAEGVIPAAFRKARRDRHVSVPVAVPPALWMSANILHAAHAAPETAVAAAALGGAVGYFARHKWDRPAECWYATASAVAAGAYLTAGSALGVTSGLPGEILGGLLAAGAAAWGIPWWRHYRPRGRRQRMQMLAGWAAWWDGHCAAWSLPGSRVIDASESGVTVRIRVQLMPGRQSVQQVKGAVPLIESALQGLADIGRIRVEPVKGNPSQVDLFLKRENPLRRPVTWDPAMAPSTVHEDWPLGLTETGQWRMLPQRKSSFTVGATRGGKSNQMLLRMLCLAGCPDALTVLIDLKGGRSARPALEAAAADYVITTVEEARMWMLLACAEIEARAKHWYTGSEQGHATPDVPAVFTLIDETHGLTSVTKGDSQCARDLATMASQGAGLEFYEDVVTQYGALDESVRTEQTRSNLPMRFAYRCDKAEHASFAIPESAQLDASVLEEQGTCYAKDGPKTAPEQVRAVHVPHDMFRAEAAAAVAARGPKRDWVLFCGADPCPTGGTWQQWWDERWLRLDEAFRAISPQYAQALRSAPSPDMPDTPARAVTDPEASPAVTVGSDAKRVAAQIEREVDYPDFDPDPKLVRKIGDVVRDQKDRFCEALQHAGTAGISPGQLQEESQMGRTWIQQTLAALVERGTISQVKRGLYVPTGDVREGLAAIAAGNDALLKDARKTVKRLDPVS